MNISSVSFSGINRNQELGYNEPIPYFVNNHFPDPERVAQRDEYVPRRTTEQRRPERPKQNRKLHSGIKGFAAGLAAALMIHCGAAMGENKPDVVKVPYNPQETSITEIAEQYDCDEDIIRAYNNIYYDSQLNEIEELQIPTEYDYLQPQIDELTKKLYSSKLSQEERNETEAQVEALRTKQTAQKQVAKVYTDGKTIYYLIDFTDENGESIYGSINVETFKDLFDIKDGAIRKNNDLDSKWKKDTNMEEDKGYFDYTGNYFVSGDKVVVHKGDIQEKDVNLEGFIQ